ncbi:MAG: hypothetical protein UT36_C0003G0046 [Candidatus Peregrinibacteria bacterium GW2011_GWF2_39_17]|nr:MAG: hypothetical protein UT36_C0003G0046 [Candidatus Peregrinibacteria bacterium GW2011_GWF2_39_17]HCW31991.1 hypothetical protein [Candidatus Peregrinibacteria bacterium]
MGNSEAISLRHDEQEVGNNQGIYTRALMAQTHSGHSSREKLAAEGAAIVDWVVGICGMVNAGYVPSEQIINEQFPGVALSFDIDAKEICFTLELSSEIPSALYIAFQNSQRLQSILAHHGKFEFIRFISNTLNDSGEAEVVNTGFPINQANLPPVYALRQSCNPLLGESDEAETAGTVCAFLKSTDPGQKDENDRLPDGYGVPISSSRVDDLFEMRGYRRSLSDKVFNWVSRISGGTYERKKTKYFLI